MKLKENNSFDLNLISKYRSVFFALSILLIMFHHTGSSVPTFIKPAYLFARDTGAVGVDIFMFYSGLGCYYSMIKDSNFISFYKKRILRIYPSFLLVMVPYLAYVNFFKESNGFLKYIYDLSLLGFWIEGSAIVWFMAAILFLYLIYPFIHKLLCEHDIKFSIISLLTALLIICVILYFFAQPFFYYTIRVITRFPTFLLGCIVAKYIKQGININGTKMFIISCVIFVLSLSLIYIIYANPLTLFLNSFVKRLLYFPLSVSMIGIISYLLSITKNHGEFLVQNRFLNIIAAMTFELYLIHERVMSIGKEIFVKFNINFDRYRIADEVIYLVVAIILAYAVYWITNSLRTHLAKRSIKNER
jgi:peptidoglycan/LPS O-acetylase OafA/YrhL